MYDFWYDYVKPNYGENTKLCYLDKDTFIVHIKRWFLKGNSRRCWNKFDTSDFELERPLPKIKNKKK